MDLIKLFAGGFPLTTETVQFLQNSYKKPIEALTNLAGDGVILEGIVNTAGTLSAGSLIKNKEIIPFISSALGATVYIHEHTEQVNYNLDVNNDGTLDLKDAYVTRYASTVPAVAGDVLISSFTFVSLTRLAEIRQPVGSAILWFDAVNIPKFYKACDGTNGTPDLRDKFIKMAGTEGAVNTTGGTRTKIIAVENLPSHTHSTPAVSFSRKFGTGGARSDGGDDFLKSNDANGIGSTKTFSASGGNTGGGDGIATPLNIEPSHYFAIWIQYKGF